QLWSALRTSCSRPPTSQTYTLSLHDALPISVSDGTSGDFDRGQFRASGPRCCVPERWTEGARSVASEGDSRSPESHASLSSMSQDRKSTRLNSSHGSISYAVFCLKKK